MTVKLVKITIIAERLLKESLLEILKENGATGFTMIACEGEGSRGVNASDWEGRNTQIESIVDEQIADKIMEEIDKRFMEDYAIIVYLTNVSVLRKSKFSNEG